MKRTIFAIAVSVFAAHAVAQERLPTIAPENYSPAQKRRLKNF